MGTIIMTMSSLDCPLVQKKQADFYKNLGLLRTGSDEENQMNNRSCHIHNICNRIKITQSCTYFESVSGNYNQQLTNHFLQDPNTGSIYCYIHKVSTMTHLTE